MKNLGDLADMFPTMDTANDALFGESLSHSRPKKVRLHNTAYGIDKRKNIGPMSNERER